MKKSDVLQEEIKRLQNLKEKAKINEINDKYPIGMFVLIIGKTWWFKHKNIHESCPRIVLWWRKNPRGKKGVCLQSVKGHGDFIEDYFGEALYGIGSVRRYDSYDKMIKAAHKAGISKDITDKFLEAYNEATSET